MAYKRRNRAFEAYLCEIADRKLATSKTKVSFFARVVLACFRLIRGH